MKRNKKIVPGGEQLLPPPPPSMQPAVVGAGVKNISGRMQKLFLGKYSVTIGAGGTLPIKDLIELSGMSAEEIDETLKASKHFEYVE